MKLFTRLFIIGLTVAAISSCDKQKSSELTIGIIEPLEHTAMNEIVAGFSDTLSQLYHQPVRIKVENAQSDANLQRAIIQKMRDAGYTMIVPIGVGATQMSLSMVHNQPVVSLASDLTQANRDTLKPCNAAVVHDEISANQLIEFVHTVYPKLTQLMLIHSSADKVLPEVKETIEAGKKFGITVNHMMVSTLPEMYSSAQAIPQQTQGIIVLKDSLIVSGISTLAKVAADRHIPLITSDQGSVQDGATFALGVHERQIGVEGAKLAAAVLQGQSICSLPVVEMKNLTVFINQKSLQQDTQPIEPIKTAANQLHYSIETIQPVVVK